MVLSHQDAKHYKIQIMKEERKSDQNDQDESKSNQESQIHL
jgi:hypothetical protein